MQYKHIIKTIHKNQHYQFLMLTPSYRHTNTHYIINSPNKHSHHQSSIIVTSYATSITQSTQIRAMGQQALISHHHHFSFTNFI